MAVRPNNRNLCALILRMLKVYADKFHQNYRFLDTSTDVIAFSFRHAQAAQVHPPPPRVPLPLPVPPEPLARPNQRSVNILRELDELGRGAYGVVVKAVTSESVIVAVKKAISSSEELLREAAIMLSLDHPNVVKFIAMQRNPDRLILEFIDGPDAFNWLQNQGTFGEHVVENRVLIKMASDIATGMRYLSDARIVHRDLAARNILVSTSMMVKISDFGLATRMPDGSDEIVDNILVPTRWMPPEAIRSGLFNFGTDVFSFGVVVWELFSLASERPYSVNITSQLF